MPNYLRSCTDVICAGVLVLIIGAFVGLLIYGLVAGSPLSVISIYNGSQVRCDLDANFPCKLLSIQSVTSPTATAEAQTEQSAWPRALQLQTRSPTVWQTQSTVLEGHSLRPTHHSP